MRPLMIGRALGIGVRVAGRVVGQRLTEGSQTAGPSMPATQPVRNTSVQASGATPTRVQGGNIGKGVGGFLRPFRRVGGVLWLEIMGAFFLLPVAAFGPNLWRMRANWAHGPDHNVFLVTAGIVLLFLYLGVSSFWRARQRARQD